MLKIIKNRLEQGCRTSSYPKEPIQLYRRYRGLPRINSDCDPAVVSLCEAVQKEHPRSIFFLGQLVFENDRFYYRFLHNETAFAIQRRLQFAGLQAVVLPIRVLERKKRLRKAS